MTQKKIVLAAEKRTILGKKVKALRKQGLLPANIFGSEMKSQSIQVKSGEFSKVFSQAGTTHVVYISLGSGEIPILITATHRNPLTDVFLHADFKQVNLKEKVEAEVPVVITGENELVESGEADALVVSDTVRIEALPTDIPENFTIDISVLKEIGDHFTVGQLEKSATYTFVDEIEMPLVQLTEAKKEEVVPQESPSPDSVEATEEKPEEGGEKQEEKKEEKKEE